MNSVYRSQKTKTCSNPCSSVLALTGYQKLHPYSGPEDPAESDTQRKLHWKVSLFPQGLPNRPGTLGSPIHNYTNPQTPVIAKEETQQGRMNVLSKAPWHLSGAVQQQQQQTLSVQPRNTLSNK